MHLEPTNTSTQSQGVPQCGIDAIAHREACAYQVDTAEQELARLQGLLDDAMSRLAGAFETLAGAAEAQRQEHASGVLVSTLQYHDICSQLLGHARKRLATSRALMQGEIAPHEHDPAAHDLVPVLHTDMAPGDVDLF
jgi:hypothetical protein